MAEKNNEIDETTIYNHTDYVRRSWLNALLVSMLLGVIFVMLWFISDSVINATLLPYIETVANQESIKLESKSKDFIRNLLMDGEISEDAREKTRIYLNSVNTNRYYVVDDIVLQNYIRVLLKTLLYASVILVGLVISFYIRNNADTIFANYGTLQKRATIAGMQENLALERRITLSKLEQRRVDMDIKKQRKLIQAQKKKTA